MCESVLSMRRCPSVSNQWRSTVGVNLSLEWRQSWDMVKEHDHFLHKDSFAVTRMHQQSALSWEIRDQNWTKDCALGAPAKFSNSHDLSGCRNPPRSIPCHGNPLKWKWQLHVWEESFSGTERSQAAQHSFLSDLGAFWFFVFYLFIPNHTYHSWSLQTAKRFGGRLCPFLKVEPIGVWGCLAVLLALLPAV